MTLDKIYYETIKIETICKNGSEKFGAEAITNISESKDGSRKMEITQFGKTKVEAEAKLLKFLTDNSVCIGQFNSENK
jgi:hypothetical protein